jgi:hypothetical protein
MNLPETVRTWVLGDPGGIWLTTKPVPAPRWAGMLVRIDAVAICATDLDILHCGSPARSCLGGDGGHVDIRPCRTWRPRCRREPSLSLGQGRFAFWSFGVAKALDTCPVIFMGARDKDLTSPDRGWGRCRGGRGSACICVLFSLVAGPGAARDKRPPEPNLLRRRTQSSQRVCRSIASWRAATSRERPSNAQCGEQSEPRSTTLIAGLPPKAAA